MAICTILKYKFSNSIFSIGKEQGQGCILPVEGDHVEV